MKRLIITLLVLFTAISSFAQPTQYPVGQNLGNANTLLNTNNGGLKANHILLSFADTAAANATPHISFNDGSEIRVGDSIFLRSRSQWVLQTSTATNIPSLPDGLISVPPFTLVDTTLTINPNIVWRRDNINYTQTTSSVFQINKADSGYSRFDLIYIDSLNVIRLIEGVEDTGVVVPSAMPPHGIQVTIVSIVGDVVQQPIPSISTNYWSPNGNNISSGTPYLGTLNSKPINLITGGQVRWTVDNIGQFGEVLTNNGQYPNAITLYNSKDSSLPSFNFFTNTAGGRLSINANNDGFLNPLYISKSNGADSIYGGAYSNMYLQDYGYLKYNSTSSQRSIFETTAGNSPLFSVLQYGSYFGSDTTAKPSAIVTMASTTQGFLAPRMTTTDMNAINLPSNGLLIYNLTDSAFYYRKVDTWVKVGSGSGGGSTGDTLFVRTPLKVNDTNDTLYMNQVSDVDSGWVSPDQKAFWDLGGMQSLQQILQNSPDYPNQLLNFSGGFVFADSLQFVQNLYYTTSGVDSGATGQSTFGAHSVNIDGASVQGDRYSMILADAVFNVNMSNTISGNGSSFSLDTTKAVFFNGDSTFRVGINTGIPSMALEVHGDGTNTAAFINGNVGIGTTTPSNKLHVVGSSLIQNGLLTVLASGSGVYLDDATITSNTSGLMSGNADEQIATYNSVSGDYKYGNGSLLINGGNVGIGTPTPDSGLTLVNKGFKYDVASKGAGKVLTSDANGAATWQTPSGGGVTSVATGYGLSGGTITTTGTLLVDSAALSLKYLRRGDSILNGGYTSLYQYNKGKDSLQTNINLKADIASPTFTGNPVLSTSSATSIVIGGTLGSSSLFDVQSTTKGVLIPRMTTTQRDAISSAGSQLLITNTTTNNLDKYNGTEWEPVSAALTDAVLAMNAGGSPFIAETVGMNSPLSILGSSSLGSGAPGYCAIYIDKRTTLTGASFFMATQGNFTGNNVNSIGLYSYSGGTITKIAETANDPNIWKNTSSTFVQVPFSSTISVAAGLYFLAVSYSSSAQTTAPALGRGTTMLSAVQNSPVTTNSFKLYSFRTGQTSLPSTESMSNLTANGNPFYLAVY